MRARARRRARRLLRRPSVLGLHRPTSQRIADVALRQPLAPREEGSGRGAVGAEAADRLLARPQRPGEVPRRRPRRHPRMEQGVRAHRLQGRDPGRDAARRRRLRHVRRAPRVGALDDVAREPAFGGDRPVAVDPRTGEILDADIGIDPVRCASRATAAFVASRRRPLAGARRASRRATPTRLCTYAPDCAAHESGFALDVLEARGDIEPGQPRGRGSSCSPTLKDVVMHEVGHTLGLRHNFRASTIYTQAQLADPEFTRAQRHRRLGDGVQRRSTSRVKGEPQGEYVDADARSLRLLGDRVRVQASSPPETEAAELAKIAARGASEPLLAFATDEDATSPASIRDANQFDLGARSARLRCRSASRSSRELWERLQTAAAEAGRELRGAAAQLRRAASGRSAERAALTREVRRRRHVRCATAPAAAARRSRRSPPDKQREALKLLADRRVRRPTASASSPSSCAACGSTTSTSATTLRARPSDARRRRLRSTSRCSALQRGVLEPAAERRRRAAPARHRGQGRRARAGAAARRALRHAARRRSGASSRPAGDIPLLRRNLQREYLRRVATRADAAVADDAGRRARAAARGREGAVGARSRPRRERQPRCRRRARTSPKRRARSTRR